MPQTIDSMVIDLKNVLDLLSSQPENIDNYRKLYQACAAAQPRLHQKKYGFDWFPPTLTLEGYIGQEFVLWSSYCPLPDTKGFALREQSGKRTAGVITSLGTIQGITFYERDPTTKALKTEIEKIFRFH